MPARLIPFFAWLALGAVGLVVLALGTDLAALRELGVPADLSDPALRALISVQPALLLVAGVGVGVMLAPAVELRSWLTARLLGETPPGVTGRGLAVALGLGFVTGLIVVGLDLIVAAGLGTPVVAATPDPVSALLALTYGGITEELMMRYGLMTLLVWLGAQIWTSRPAALYWGGIVLAGVLFGAGHLPAMAAIAPLTPLVILRTVGLNALLGLVYGWLFWRKGLEHAMLAHMATHLSFWTMGALL